MSYRPDGTFGPAADRDMLTDEQSRFVAARMTQEAAGGGNSPLRPDVSGRPAAGGHRTAPTVYGYVNDKGRKFDFDDLRRHKESSDDMANATKGVKQFVKALNSTGTTPDMRRRLVGDRGAKFVDAVTSAFQEEALRASPTGGVVRVVDPSTGDRFSFPYSRLVTDEDDRRLRIVEALKYGGQNRDANANPGDLLVPDERAVRGIHVRQMDAKGGKSAS